MIDQKALQIIIDSIVKTASPQKIILFGSAARNEMNAESDIDLLVIKSEVKDWLKEITSIKLNLMCRDFSFDIILVSEAEYLQKLGEGWTLFKNAESEGLILYAA